MGKMDSNKPPNNTTKPITNDNNILSKTDVDMVLKLIEVVQSRGRIPAADMLNIGSKYLTLKSYIIFNSFSKDTQNEIIKTEAYNPEKKKIYKKIKIPDLVFYYNFINAHLNLNNFIESELKAANELKNKLFNTFKKY